MFGRWWFQFTPVVRRATRPPLEVHHVDRVSIHARRVTGDNAGPRRVRDHYVSIHARRVTGDSHYHNEQARDQQFQFTPVV